jgi:hypothetical protein
MKKIYFITLVFPFILLNCLKAKRSPFDVSKPSPGLVGTITAIMNGSFSSTSPNATTSPTSTTTTPSSLLPSVTSTSPADASTGITANTPVIITFNMTMDKTSITTNSDDTTCSGSVQISFDNFVTCVKMRSSITTTDNKTFTLTANPTMGTFATHKIKVTTTAKSDTSVKLATDYSHATGFTTSTPCTVYDAATCPIPFSTAATMTGSLGNGGMVIPIESGAAKGKIFVVLGNSTTTNIFNPDTGLFSVGPNTTATVNTNGVPTYFSINSGVHAGKYLFTHGPITTTSIFDPVTNTMISGPNLTTNAGLGSNAFQINSGSNSGKTLLILSGVATNLYDHTTNTFSIGPNLTSTLGNASHSIGINSGLHNGKTLIVYAGGVVDTSLYDPSSNTFSVGPNLTTNAWGGAFSFSLSTGIQSGNIFTVIGNETSFSNIYNSASGTFAAGPTIPGLPVGKNTPDVGTHSIMITSGVNAGKLWLLSGVSNSYTYSTSAFYDLNSNSFSVGPNLITILAGNSKTIYIESGIYSGKYMTFYAGSNAKFTSLYDPIKNAIDPSSILPSSAGNGINKVLLTSGSNSGKMLVINGGNNTSSLFDFASGTFSPGPNLTGVMGRSPGIFTISGGSQDGKIFVVHGGGIATTSIYDPVANSFSAGPALSANANQITSECIFKIPSGPQVGKYLIILSGVSQNTSLYDPSNNTIAAGPATGALMGPNSVTCFPIASGANAGKFIATQGAITPTTATRIYDPATNTFAAGPNLATNIAAGSFAIPITIGTNSGKVLLFIGGTTTNLYDPATHTFSVGPNLSASATGGAYLLLTVGANKDKYWILHGNTSSIYDPNTNSITAGVALPDGGTMAFNLTSGLFNQGVLVVTGSGNLTSILYP